jgi:hypothetical protein
VRRCQYPVWQPTPRRSSDCHAPASMAAPLGATGRWLALCPDHAPHRVDAVPLSQVPEL